MTTPTTPEYNRNSKEYEEGHYDGRNANRKMMRENEEYMRGYRSFGSL